MNRRSKAKSDSVPSALLSAQENNVVLDLLGRRCAVSSGERGSEERLYLEMLYCRMLDTDLSL